MGILQAYTCIGGVEREGEEVGRGRREKGGEKKRGERKCEEAKVK